jgi:putative FmdB family regulatory protein
MPVYEYKCSACRKKFSEKLSISQMEKRTPKCPKCGSAKTEKLITGFIAVTAKKS